MFASCIIPLAILVLCLTSTISLPVAAPTAESQWGPADGKVGVRSARVSTKAAVEDITAVAKTARDSCGHGGKEVKTCSSGNVVGV